MRQAAGVLLRIVIVVGAVAASLVIVALAVGPDKKALTDAVHADSGADFIELSEGFVEYEIAGPQDGVRVVLVHGLPVPMYDWDAQFTNLAARGFRVLRYNQYGRGLSDRPRGRYDLERYTGQLMEIIGATIPGKVNLVAHSMGGVVAAAFAAEHPELVDRVVLVSPGLSMAEDNVGVTLVRIPLLGDFAAKVILPGVLAGRADSLVENTGIPAAAAALAALLPGMERIVLEGVGHVPNMQDPDLVNELIVEFLEP